MIQEMLYGLAAGTVGGLAAGLSAPLACRWPNFRSGALKHRLRMIGDDLPGPRRRRTGLALVVIVLGGAGLSAVAAAPPEAPRRATPAMAATKAASGASSAPRPGGAAPSVRDQPAAPTSPTTPADIDLQQSDILLGKTLAMLADVRLARIKDEALLARALQVSTLDLYAVVDDQALGDLTRQYDQMKVAAGDDSISVQRVQQQIEARAVRVQAGLQARVEADRAEEQALQNELDEQRGRRQDLEAVAKASRRQYQAEFYLPTSAPTGAGAAGFRAVKSPQN